MNHTTNIVIAGVLLSLASLPAYSSVVLAKEKPSARAEHGEAHHARRSEARHGAGHGGMGGQGMLMTFDSDGNGRVTQAEIDAFRGERLAKFDSDNNGSLSLSEYQALWLAAMRERMVDRFQVLDADGDAAVTLKEFKRPYANMVRHMDKNDDGELSRDDMRPKHGMRPKHEKENEEEKE